MANVVTKDMIPAYEAFVQSHPKGHFCQSVLWAKQKPMWKWEAVVSTDTEGNIKGSLAMLIRKVPGTPYTLMYICRGPVCDLDDQETLTDLVNGAKEMAKRYKSYEIKIDPDVPSSNTEFTKMMTDLGFVITGGGKNFEAIQPKYVFRLNIEGKTEEEIMAAFHQKTRYNLRLAVKKGVEVRLCGKEAVEDFTRIMEVTGARDGFVTRQASYFANMLDNLGEHCRLYMAYHEGRPIAGTLAIWYGDKVWYLYGASSNEDRNLMPNYLLQWNMIQWAVEKGCRIYDFRGVSGDLTPENPLYGLYKFKKGFGGEFTEFVGEMDMILKPGVAFAVKHGTKLMKRMRKNLYMIKNRNKK